MERRAVQFEKINMRTRLILYFLLLVVYAVFHFGFRTYGGTRLYRIDDRIAFEVMPETDSFNGVTVRGYRQTNPFIRFVCGACEADYAEVDMVSAKYIKGEYVYTDNPQHEKAKTDIVNLRTGETINVEVPGKTAGKVDLMSLPEYRERDLQADERYRLTAVYVRANFPALSTYTGTCILINIGFAALAFLIAFPQILLALVNAFANDDDNTNSYSGDF
jgi:hypothetical protein